VVGTSWKDGNVLLLREKCMPYMKLWGKWKIEASHMLFLKQIQRVWWMESTIRTAVFQNIVRLFVILKMYLTVIQTLWWSLSIDKRTWSPIHLLEWPFLELVAVFVRYYLFVFPLYWIMKWYEFLIVKKNKIIEGLDWTGGENPISTQS
jgi:hypothetical protein